MNFKSTLTGLDEDANAFSSSQLSDGYLEFTTLRFEDLGGFEYAFQGVGSNLREPNNVFVVTQVCVA